jgi:hypothetical protein
MIMQEARRAHHAFVEGLPGQSVPLHQARKSAPVTPKAAHSVAVAKPRISERKTAAISSENGQQLGATA